MKGPFYSFIIFTAPPEMSGGYHPLLQAGSCLTRHTQQELMCRGGMVYFVRTRMKCNNKTNFAMHFFVRSPEETKRFAARMIKKYVAQPRTSALCVALEGELGAGKTTFVQGAARALGITRPMPSPTFILMREVRLPKSYRGITTLYHFDWYRLHRAESITQLGWREILCDPAHMVIVEWADKFPSLLPAGAVRVALKHQERGRKITIRT